MHRCIDVCAYTYIYIHTFTCICIHVSVHMYDICIYVYMCTYMQFPMYIIYLFIHVRTQMIRYVGTHVNAIFIVDLSYPVEGRIWSEHTENTTNKVQLVMTECHLNLEDKFCPAHLQIASYLRSRLVTDSNLNGSWLLLQKNKIDFCSI